MRIVHEPLAHFLLIGAVIFAISEFTGGSAASSSPAVNKQIVVTAEKVALLKNGFVLDNQRPPTDAELQRLIDGYVREEVLVREAMALGLDRDDSIVRRRLVQKMEFAVPEPAAPSDAELEKYLAQNPAAFLNAAGKLPALADIHGAVQAAWAGDQRRQAADEMYRKYKAEYQVTVERPAATQAGTGAGGGGS